MVKGQLASVAEDCPAQPRVSAAAATALASLLGRRQGLQEAAEAGSGGLNRFLTRGLRTVASFAWSLFSRIEEPQSCQEPDWIPGNCLCSKTSLLQTFPFDAKYRALYKHDIL